MKSERISPFWVNGYQPFSAHVLRKMDRKVYGLNWQFNKNIFHHVCRVSIWSMFNPFIGVASWFAFFVAIEHLGELELAATNVIRSISTLFFVIVNSLAATTGSLVSNLLGAGQKNQIFPLCNRVIRLGYAVGLPLIIFSIICFNPLFNIYSDNESLMQIAQLPFTVAFVELCFCLTWLCIYECCHRDRCHTYNFHFSDCNHYSLPDLFMDDKQFQLILIYILDCRILICDIAWSAFHYLS